MPLRNMILLASLLLPTLGAAQDRCTSTYQAEQDRITREYSAKPPARGDRDAEIAWSKALHAALAQSARNAEECTRTSRSAASPAVTAKLDDCIGRVNRQLQDAERRYQGRTPSAAEQAALRAEHERLADERMACVQRSRP